MKKLLNKLLKDNDLIIISGNDFRVYGRAVYNDDKEEFYFITDDSYKIDIKSEDFLFYSCSDMPISYLIGYLENVKISIKRQKPSSKTSEHIFYIEK